MEDLPYLKERRLRPCYLLSRRCLRTCCSLHCVHPTCHQTSSSKKTPASEEPILSAAGRPGAWWPEGHGPPQRWWGGDGMWLRVGVNHSHCVSSLGWLQCWAASGRKARHPLGILAQGWTHSSPRVAAGECNLISGCGGGQLQPRPCLWEGQTCRHSGSRWREWTWLWPCGHGHHDWLCRYPCKFVQATQFLSISTFFPDEGNHNGHLQDYSGVKLNR